MACGARTALVVGAEEEVDAAPDAFLDTGLDVVSIDALPPIDASAVDHAAPGECADASDTQIYLFTLQDELYSFYPPSLAFQKVGDIACSGSQGTPYSMAVSRKGLAYALFTSGEVFRLSTATAACSGTGYVPGQIGWTTFGMGYAATPDGGDALYVTEANFMAPSKGLGTIDTSTLKLQFIHAFSSPLPRCELTGTGDGRLFAFCLNQGAAGGILAQVDPTNANVVAQDELAVGDPSNGFAFAFWGGVFWIFTGTPTTTTVTKYDPATKDLPVRTAIPLVLKIRVTNFM